MLEVIFKRRSIRKYTAQPVAEEAVTNLLRAAMSAPSARDQRPWHFIVIRERALLDAIPGVHPHSQMLREASVAILVCCDPRLEKTEGYWAQDCAAATENILLAATAQDLGAVWLGVYPRQERVEGIRGLLGIPPEVIPFSLVPVGYPAEQKAPKGEIDPQKVHHERW